jgi:hypothetical protein
MLGYHMKRFLPFICSAVIFPVSLQGGEPEGAKVPLVPDIPDTGTRSHFKISAGAAYRSIGRVNFQSSSQSGQVRLPFLAVALGRNSAAVGKVDSYADRAYLDGYVRQDAGTERDGSTWNWGYGKASQLSGNSGGTDQSLTFQGEANSATRNERSRRDQDPGSWDVDGDGAVPAVQLEWIYEWKPELSLGVSIQYSLLSFDGLNTLNNFHAFQSQTSYEVKVTDLYALGGVIAPQAPYEGNSEGPGPLIDNRPASRRFNRGRTLDEDVVHFYNAISESLKVRLHHFTLGPTVTSRLGPVQVTLGTGLSLDIADWEAAHTETLYVRKRGQGARVYQQWAEETHGTDLLPGVYLQGAVTLPLTSRLSLTAYGQYDWIRTLSGGAGASRFTVDPSGWMLGGMLGYSF